MNSMSTERWLSHEQHLISKVCFSFSGNAFFQWKPNFCFPRVCKLMHWTRVGNKQLYSGILHIQYWILHIGLTSGWPLSCHRVEAQHAVRRHKEIVLMCGVWSLSLWLLWNVRMYNDILSLSRYFAPLRHCVWMYNYQCLYQQKYIMMKWLSSEKQAKIKLMHIYLASAKQFIT